jgi:hypothetical protein
MKKSIIILVLMRVALGHQPVMDMAPRWAGGWGFQFRYETLGSNKLLDGEYSNAGLSHYRNTTWFEGVYTWKRSIRATFKLPYHQIKNEKQLIDWGDPIEKGNGLGDLILALPLKKYFNLNRSTGNFGITPQIRLKTGDDSDIIKSKGGYGLSFSYSAENFSNYQLYDLYGWLLDDGSSVLGVDVNLGWHPIHKNETNSGLFLMWDGTFQMKSDKDGNSDVRLFTGPIAVLYRGGIMGRIDVKFPVSESVERASLSQGIMVQTGIGFVF